MFAEVAAAPDPQTRGASVSFRESGLAPGSAVNLVVTADGSANYGCADASGRLAGPSLPVTGQVSTLGRLHADTSGTLSATLLLKPPPPQGIECQPAQRSLATSARFTHVEVSDVTNRVRTVLGGELSVP